MTESPNVPEAPMAHTDSGIQPDGEGWFVVNVAEAAGMHTVEYGDGVIFERRLGDFEDFGINVRVIQPGQPNSMYHRESVQEAFLVLGGECIAVIEGQERDLRKGDFVHAPAGTAHVFVGAGNEPCVILMVGARGKEIELEFPADEAAARHGASAAQTTSDPEAVYEGTRPIEFKRVPIVW